MFSSLKTKQKGVILVLIPVMFELIFVAILACWIFNAEHDLAQIQHATKTIQRIQNMNNAIALGMVSIGSEGNTTFEERQTLEFENIAKMVNSTDSFVGFNEDTNPELKEVYEQAVEIREQALGLLKQMRRVFDDPTIPVGSRMKYLPREEILFTMMNLRNMSQQVMDIESRVSAEEPEKIAQLQQQLGGFLIFGVGCSCLITIFLARFFIVDIEGRLYRISESAHMIAAGNAPPPAVPGTDEMAELELALNHSGKALSEFWRRERAILDNAADIILTLDGRLRIVRVNQAVSKIWNYTPDELLGTPLMNLVTPGTMDNTKTELEALSEKGDAESEFENIVKCKDGTLKNSLWKVHSSTQDKTFYCVVHDVTELRAVSNQKKKFVAIVGQDLRGPLNKIKEDLDELTADGAEPLSEAALVSLERTDISLKRLIELVNELLELEKLEAGKLTLNLAPTSAARVCTLAADSLETLAQKAGVRVSRPTDDGTMLAEEKRLVQVITNLLSNAIKFSPKHSTITFAVSHKDDFVEISVADQGPGIPIEDRALIFEKFGQSQAASNLEMKSTGVGLAIVKAIVELHGGCVGVESQIGKGSTFWIRVPVLKSNQEPTC